MTGLITSALRAQEGFSEEEGYETAFSPFGNEAEQSLRTWVTCFKKLLLQLECREGVLGDTNMGGKVGRNLLFCKLTSREGLILFKKHKQKNLI